jgi:hypothetical protein
MTDNKNVVLRLNGSALLKKSNAANAHQLSMRAGVSAYTAYKYLQDPSRVKAVDLKVLTKLLIEGAGLSRKEILDMRVGDLFEISEDNE